MVHVPATTRYLRTKPSAFSISLAWTGPAALLVALAGWPASAGALELKGDDAPFSVAAPTVPTRSSRALGAARYALFISVDGLSHGLLTRYLGRLPNLRRLAARGSLRPMQAVFPTMTWNNHVSAVTGQYPRHHGVLGNRWFSSTSGLMLPYAGSVIEPDRRARTPSLYDLVSARGWTAAALNWPATQHATTLAHNLPETMGTVRLPYAWLSPRLRGIYRQLYRRRRRTSRRWRRGSASRVLGRLLVREDLRADRLVRDLAMALVRRSRRARIPRLSLVHLVAADHWMHGRGWSSPAIPRVLVAIDRMIGDLLRRYRRAGIWKDTAVFVFSDHGFADVTHTVDLWLLLKRRGLARYRRYKASHAARERVLALANGHAAYIYVSGDDTDRTRRVMQALRSPALKRCLAGIYLPDQYSRLGLPVPPAIAGEQSRSRAETSIHAGAPTLIALARPECAFRAWHSRRIIRRARHRFGNHGYLPNHPALQAFLIASGPGLRRRGPWRKPARIVDIAPTAAQLLGLRWPKKWGDDGGDAFKLDGHLLLDSLSP